MPFGFKISGNVSLSKSWLGLDIIFSYRHRDSAYSDSPGRKRYRSSTGKRRFFVWCIDTLANVRFSTGIFVRACRASLRQAKLLVWSNLCRSKWYGSERTNSTSNSSFCGTVKADAHFVGQHLFSAFVVLVWNRCLSENIHLELSEGAVRANMGSFGDPFLLGTFLLRIFGVGRNWVYDIG